MRQSNLTKYERDQWTSAEKIERRLTETSVTKATESIVKSFKTERTKPIRCAVMSYTIFPKSNIL